MLFNMHDLSSLARSWTCAPWSGRVDSYLPDCQASPNHVPFLHSLHGSDSVENTEHMSETILNPSSKMHHSWSLDCVAHLLRSRRGRGTKCLLHQFYFDYHIIFTWNVIHALVWIFILCSPLPLSQTKPPQGKKFSPVFYCCIPTIPPTSRSVSGMYYVLH